MRYKIITVLMVIMTSFIVSCGNNTPTAAPELPVIRVGWVAWPGFYPIVLIKELGLDVKHGFRLESVFQKNITDSGNDWETNKIDAANIGIDEIIKQNNTKPDMAKVILISDRSPLDTIVALPEIKTIADLKGKRIGAIIGTVYGELMVRRMLEAQGLSIKDVELVNMDGSDILDAMPKLLDAGTTWEPHLTKAKQKGLNVIYSSAEDPTLPLSTGLIIRSNVIQEHPEAVRGLVAAWFEALALWQADPAKYGPMVAKVVGGTAEEAANSQANFISLEQNIQQFADESLVKEAQVATDFLISIGQLNRAPDIKTLFDASFLKP